jgi:alcohol dehydrogenase
MFERVFDNRRADDPRQRPVEMVTKRPDGMPVRSIEALSSSERGTTLRAVVFEEFGGTLALQQVPAPEPARDGVVVEVRATGVCRSDWHAWQGHDSNVSTPHVAGHELAGTISALGEDVHGWAIGDRVTVPFVCGCGGCAECARGDQQVCAHQFQPGSTHWGSFADFVAIERAQVNLIALPDWLDYAPAAALGCRFGTAFRAVLRQGSVRAGEWVSVYGCGGAGLSAVSLARAAGAKVIAVDLSPRALELVRGFGVEHTVNASRTDPVAAIAEITGGGTHLSLDCAGSAASAAASVKSLRTKGRHVQVGLLHGPVPIPMDAVIGRELRILGSHGIQAHEYPELLRTVQESDIDLEALIGKRITLDDVPAALTVMNDPVPATPGVTVVEL